MRIFLFIVFKLRKKRRKNFCQPGRLWSKLNWLASPLNILKCLNATLSMEKKNLRADLDDIYKIIVIDDVHYDNVGMVQLSMERNMGQMAAVFSAPLLHPMIEIEPLCRYCAELSHSLALAFLLAYRHTFSSKLQQRKKSIWDGHQYFFKIVVLRRQKEILFHI